MISEQVPVKNHKGNNSAREFTFDFYIENEEQLLVTHTDLDGNVTYPQLNIDYRIDVIKNSEGSKIIFPLRNSSYGVLAYDETTDTAENLCLSLDLPISQEAEYGLSEYLNMENLEYSFDYLTRLVQILSRKIDRAVKVGEGIDIDTAKLVTNIDVLVKHVNYIVTCVEDKVNIDAVAGNKINIDKVAAIDSDVTDVANIKEQVTTVAGIKNQVITNATNEEQIKTNHNNINAIKNCSQNMSAITAAPTHAQTATDQAGIATTQAGIATTKADAAIAALADAEQLKGSLQLFRTINCGNLSDERNIILDAGDLTDMYENMIDCGGATDNYIADDDLFNMLNIPLLQKQADKTNEDLDTAVSRISQNESDIATLESHLADTDEDLADEVLRIDGEISDATDRITTNEGDIDTLQDGLADTVLDVIAAENRITQNESDILELQQITGLFSYLDCGNLSDTRNTYYNAGTLTDMYPASDIMNCGNLDKFYVCIEDLKNILTIPTLLNMINNMQTSLTDALSRIASLERGYDCGILELVR